MPDEQKPINDDYPYLIPGSILNELLNGYAAAPLPYTRSNPIINKTMAIVKDTNAKQSAKLVRDAKKKK